MAIKTHRYFLVVLLSLLTACGQVTPPATETPSATQVPATATLFPLPTFTPTINVSHLEPTSAPFVGTPPASTLPKFPMHGYVMTFVKDGYLYFQDGENPAFKVTSVDEKSNAYGTELSYDNQKILYYKNNGSEYVQYSINVDGTEERSVVPVEWTASLESGTIMETNGLIPYTHKVLVTTSLCESQEGGAPCRVNLFIADTDTGEVVKLMDLELANVYIYAQCIEVSPNGKMVAIGTPDSTDIFTLDGKAIRENILPYTPIKGAYPDLFWLPDSSGLVLALPDITHHSTAHGDLLASSIWRYSIENNISIHVPMEMPPIGTTYQVSPDRKWALYGGLGSGDETVYLGDLTTGRVQIVGKYEQPHFSWGPDGRYFTYGVGLENMSTIDNSSYSIPVCGDGWWIDSNHFTCIIPESYAIRLSMAVIEGGEVKNYTLGLEMNVVNASVFIKQK